MNRLYNGNCLDILPIIDSKSIDLIIADPPFGIDFKTYKSNYNRKSNKIFEGYTEIRKIDYYQFTYNWIAIIQNLLKDSGSVYVFSSWNNLENILACLRLNGFKVINHLIWKYNFGVYTKNKFVTSHYHLLYVCKNPKKVTFNRECRWYDNARNGDINLNYADRQSVWTINREFWKEKIRTATKLPEELVQKMILYSSNKDDIILDPFMGSGQVPFIAKKLNRKYIGIEIEKDIFEFAKLRIESGEYYINGDSSIL